MFKKGQIFKRIKPAPVNCWNDSRQSVILKIDHMPSAATAYQYRLVSEQRRYHYRSEHEINEYYKLLPDSTIFVPKNVFELLKRANAGKKALDTLTKGYLKYITIQFSVS